MRNLIAAVVVVLLCTAVVAQAPAPSQPQTPPATAQPSAHAQPPAAAQPTTPTVQQPEAEKVRLQLKFSPAQVLRYRGYANIAATMDMAISPAPPQPLPFPMPMTFGGTASGVATAKVLRMDPYGGARLRVRLDSGSMTMDMMGQKFQIALKGGKVTASGMGKKVTQEKLPKLPGGQAIPLLQKPMEVKIGKRGQLLDIAIPGFEKEWKQLMAQAKKMYGGVDLMTLIRQTQVLLPENPVAAGESWPFHYELTIPGSGAPIVQDMTFTLTKLEVVRGKQIATISVQGRQTFTNLNLGAMAQGAAAPGMPQMPGMSGKMSGEGTTAGTAVFNVTAGTFDRFDLRADFNFRMDMSVPGGPKGPPQPVSVSVSMAGQVTGALARL